MSATTAFDRVPQELRNRPQWVPWRFEMRLDSKGRKKRTKVPFDPRSGSRTSITDPATWVPFEAAVQALQNKGYDGVGFVFTANDPFAGVDLDGCRDPETGFVEPWAGDLVERLHSYTEVSPSGTGLHVIVEAKLPPGRRRKGNIEMYDDSRFFCMTGEHVDGTPDTIEDRQIEIAAFHAMTFGTDMGLSRRPASSAERHDVDLDDDALLMKARTSKNGELFCRLYDAGDISDYASQSEADLALCTYLAFWVGKNPARMDRLFRDSSLMRDKWDSMRGESTYGRMTVDKAIAGTTDVYNPSGNGGGYHPALNQRATPEPTAVSKQRLPLSMFAPRDWTLTDSGNAERLIERHGKDLRFCHIWGKWLVWDGCRWIVDHTAEVMRRAKMTVRSLYSEAAKLEDEKVRGAVVDWAKKSEKAERRRAMVSLAACEEDVPVLPDDLDSDPWLLSVANGTIDLRTGELRQHSRRDLITHLVPTAFDPEAQCSRFESFLVEIMSGRENLVTLLRRWTGYCLTGSVAEEALLFGLGAGCNGKTKLAEAIRHAVGEDLCCAAPPGLLLLQKGERHPTELKRLFGKRITFSSEVPKGSTFNEERVKSLTGGDTLSGRGMREDFFDFKPTHKLWLYGNDMPRVRDASEGFWRRFRVIPFDASFKGREDKQLSQKLYAEAPGILAWAVRGCLEWQQEGLGEPVEVVNATTAYREGEDVFGRFLADEGYESFGYAVNAADLYARYKAWARAEGERELSQTALGRELSRRGWARGRRNDGTRAVTWTPASRQG